MVLVAARSETTGLANPAPVIQTFFVDENIKVGCAGAGGFQWWGAEAQSSPCDAGGGFIGPLSGGSSGGGSPLLDRYLKEVNA